MRISDLILIARKVLIGLIVALLPIAIVMTALWAVRALLESVHANV